MNELIVLHTATLFLRDVNTGTWPSSLEESHMRQQDGVMSFWTWTPRVTGSCTTKFLSRPLVTGAKAMPDTKTNTATAPFPFKVVDQEVNTTVCTSEVASGAGQSKQNPRMLPHCNYVTSGTHVLSTEERVIRKKGNGAAS
jgi:hypothetical protein